MIVVSGTGEDQAISMTETSIVNCGWCGMPIHLLGHEALPKDAYAIERSDGDKFFFCNLDHAMWLMADWESDEWIAAESHD